MRSDTSAALLPPCIGRQYIGVLAFHWSMVALFRNHSESVHSTVIRTAYIGAVTITA
ncbi:hypothetical protein KCP75_10145 [Salmonella enterica subsp. enterica]|nr:hypothetical protein KCP75_10145 [Salmonella enterica subsp. enterica]